MNSPPPRVMQGPEGKVQGARGGGEGGAGRVKTPHQQLCGKARMATRNMGRGGPGQDGGTPLLWGQGGLESMSVNRGGSAPFLVGGELISGGRVPSGRGRGPRGLWKGMGRPRRGGHLPR